MRQLKPRKLGIHYRTFDEAPVRESYQGWSMENHESQ